GRGIVGLGFGGLCRGAWNRFGNRSGHRVFDGTRFSLSLDRRRFRVSGPSRGRRWAGLGGRRSGGSLGSLLAFGLERLALHIAHLLFEGALKISRGLAELGHELAEPSGKLRQLLWSENDQDHDKDHNHMRNAQHCVWEPSIGSMGIIERVSVAVKPEFRVCYNYRLSCHAR